MTPRFAVDGRLVGLAVASLIAAWCIWAALHDIAQQLSSSYVVESVALAVTVPSLLLLTYSALRLLGKKGRTVWLMVFAGWVLLLDAAAWNSIATGWTRTGAALESAVIAGSIPILVLVGCAVRRGAHGV
jgi:hypothetical protein